MDKRIEKILYTETEIQKQIQACADWINKKFAGKQPVLIAILKGAIPFYGSLIMKVKIDISLDFMVVSSFKGSVKSMSNPKIVTDLSHDIKGRDVILVEDIVDSGKTINAIKKILEVRNPSSISVITLLDKPSGRTVKCEPDYSCFTTEPAFLVGFGLDYKEQMRNIPYVGVLKKEIYDKELNRISGKK